jgi:hypothetical protein
LCGAALLSLFQLGLSGSFTAAAEAFMIHGNGSLAFPPLDNIFLDFQQSFRH